MARWHSSSPRLPPLRSLLLRKAAIRLRRRGAGAAAEVLSSLVSEPCRRRGSHPYPSTSSRPEAFYKDKASWMDPRYFRCNTPLQMVEQMWESGRIGPNPPASASWGDCKVDTPRDQNVSPYPYKTAKEHYEALMAQAKAHGGPTVYTKATTPDWDGFYRRDPNGADTPAESNGFAAGEVSRRARPLAGAGNGAGSTRPLTILNSCSDPRVSEALCPDALFHGDGG